MSDKPKKEPRGTNLGVMVTAAMKAELQEIADKEKRSVSNVAALLLERALIGYRDDGDLKPKPKKPGDRGLGLIRAKAEEQPRKKKPND